MTGRSLPAAPAILGLRVTGLLLVLGGGCELVRRLALTPLFQVLADPAGRPVDDLVAAGCAAALVACWLWLVACALVVAAAVVRELTRSGGSGHPVGGVPRPVPRVVAVAVLAVLGLGYGGAPALAGSSPVPEPAAGLIDGLPVPDRMPAAACERPADIGHRPPAAGTPHRAVVRPGDSLWSIAEALLPDDAPAAAVDRAWRRIADASSAVVGDDPDLIFPGTRLVVSDLHTASGKDRP